MDDTWYSGPTIIARQNENNLDPVGTNIGSPGAYFGLEMGNFLSQNYPFMSHLPLEVEYHRKSHCH